MSMIAREEFHPDMFKWEWFNSEEWREENRKLKEENWLTTESVAQEGKAIREELDKQINDVKYYINTTFRVENNQPNPMSKVTMDSLAKTLEERGWFDDFDAFGNPKNPKPKDDSEEALSIEKSKEALSIQEWENNTWDKNDWEIKVDTDSLGKTRYDITHEHEEGIGKIPKDLQKRYR